jgi:hypothetical protein
MAFSSRQHCDLHAQSTRFAPSAAQRAIYMPHGFTGALRKQCVRDGRIAKMNIPKFVKYKKNTFFAIFSRWIKAYPLAIALYTVWGKLFPKKLRGGLRMRANRVLVAKGWYWVSTDVNNREGVFRLSREVLLLREVLFEARKVYEFEVRGLRVEADRVSFYINAVDGFAVIFLNRGQLPQKPFRF